MFTWLCPVQLVIFPMNGTNCMGLNHSLICSRIFLQAGLISFIVNHVRALPHCSDLYDDVPFLYIFFPVYPWFDNLRAHVSRFKGVYTTNFVCM